MPTKTKTTNGSRGQTITETEPVIEGQQTVDLPALKLVKITFRIEGQHRATDRRIRKAEAAA